MADSPPSTAVSPAPRPSRFLVSAALTVLVLCSAVLAVNLMVDPLWFLSGNRVFPQNYVFNERQSKLNRFLQAPASYDCLIFGSSRLTLLDERDIPGYRCFNFSFSGGRPEEFLAYARYARHAGATPRRVIVGVDWDSLEVKPGNEDLADYVRTLDPPPGIFRTYLTFGALDFSLRTLRRTSPKPRYYDAELVGAVLPHPERYEDAAKPAPSERPDLPTDRVVAVHQDLRAVFPDARFLAYVPPIAASTVTTAMDDGYLESYTRIMKQIASVYGTLYDLAIPSAITRSPDNTYDGSHFYPKVNAQLMRAMLAAVQSPGFRVDQGSLAAYRAAFRAPVP
jgi:hypothetical protein